MKRQGAAFILWAFLASLLAEAVKVRERATVSANPVRKVVTMLQAMDKRLRAEEAKEQELFDRFMCYCRTGVGSLEKSVADADTKIPALKAEMQSFDEQVDEMEEALKQETADRESSKQTMAEATGLREKEQAAFQKEKDDSNANIDAARSAISSLEKGSGGSFLQTDSAGVLRRFIKHQHDMMEEDREQVISFLSAANKLKYVPQSGQIIGVLKQLLDTMEKNLDTASEQEKEAIATYDALMAAKTKEVDAMTSSIEAKQKKIGELKVSVVQMKADLEDVNEMLAADQGFLAELGKDCKAKEVEWGQRQKTRSDELLAVAETIKLLNDDDALGLFKATLPTPGTSFMQVQITTKSFQQKALRLVKKLRRHESTSRRLRVGLDLVSLAVSGKKADFDKVVELIDGMVEQLHREQKEDDEKKAYCEREFNAADDEQKVLENELEDATNSANSCKAGIQTLVEEIDALVASIKSLDKAVSEQTQQRKDENAEYKELTRSNFAARQLLVLAKNRLEKFYLPKSNKPSLGQVQFVQVEATDGREAPSAPPEYFGEYQKDSEGSAAVLDMIDMLTKGLDQDTAAAKADEEHAQAEYENFMSDSAATRVADSKALTDKESDKAALEYDLEDYKADSLSTYKALENTQQYLSVLHAQCDFLIHAYEVRQKARVGEIESLQGAKAVISGADSPE